ncbi:similar to cytochrome P450 alkane hydroxylase [Botrytis cinerea T4]|uniref:Similar to cytochrome P450 alkane hydroxylase n=1 Tax=Botryotinia fuckeliana (strain T4) TaxID=999810 RepID=G2YX16_BOTF4|nr:similar to cytochrome P450 alkane hydroxylase [Botrytis cinerea T4]
MDQSTSTVLGHSTKPAVITVFVSYVVYIIVNNLLQSHLRRVKAKKLNCKNPPAQKNDLPLGIDQIFRALKFLAAQNFPSEQQKEFKKVNALTYSNSVLGRDGFTTIDEKNIQAVLGTQFPDFDLSSQRADNFIPFLGSGIFSQDGKDWERSRALMRPQFARDNLSDLEMEERHFQVLLKALPGIEKDGWTGEIDIQPLLFRFTLDSATEFLLGQSVESQLAAIETALGTKSKQENADDFALQFDVGNMSLSKRARFVPYSWLVWPSGFKQAIKSCHSAIDRVVAENLEKMKAAGGVSDPNRYVFFEALAEQTRDPIELRTQVMNILLAGRDTTASLLAFAIFSLARDPTRYRKLREIVLEEFGTFSAPKDITFAHIKACRYLQWVMNETLRLYPVVPWNFRVANKDTTLPRGGGEDGNSKIFVKKGTKVEYSTFALHRRKDLWGEDANEFKPERWEGRKGGWEYLPFNGGPRICIGQQYALTEAGFFIVRLLQKFDQMESVDKAEPAFSLSLTMCSGNGVQVKFHEAGM